MTFCKSVVRKICLGAVLLAVTVLAGCSRQGDQTSYRPEFSAAPPGVQRVYVFAIHPLHNPKRLFEVYGPLVDYLNARVSGVRFRLEASRNYAEFDKKLEAREFHFALPNPYQTLAAVRRGYTVFGKMGDDENFRGIILVRRDGAIREVADLKDKAVSFPAPTALAATMMPQHFLHCHGLNVRRDIETRYVGSQESSIMNVYLGNVAAAATWPTPWTSFKREHPDIAGALAVQWQTDPLVNNGLVVRDDIEPGVRRQVEAALFSLHESTEGRRILARMPLSRFEPATNATYGPVQAFLDEFDRTVGRPGR
jgi:phosphonate transport system substrate-binding protein